MEGVFCKKKKLLSLSSMNETHRKVQHERAADKRWQGVWCMKWVFFFAGTSLSRWTGHLKNGLKDHTSDFPVCRFTTNNNNSFTADYFLENKSCNRFSDVLFLPFQASVGFHLFPRDMRNTYQALKTWLSSIILHNKHQVCMHFHQWYITVAW